MSDKERSERSGEILRLNTHTTPVEVENIGPPLLSSYPEPETALPCPTTRVTPARPDSCFGGGGVWSGVPDLPGRHLLLLSFLACPLYFPLCRYTSGLTIVYRDHNPFTFMYVI